MPAEGSFQVGSLRAEVLGPAPSGVLELGLTDRTRPKLWNPDGEGTEAGVSDGKLGLASPLATAE